MDREKREVSSKELVLFSALLLSLLLLFFHKAIFLGKVLSQADVLYSYSPWRHYASQWFQPSNPLLLDQSKAFYPWLTFAARNIRAGSLPFWNPYAYAGSPFIANGQSAVFFPGNWIFFLLPTDWIAYGSVVSAVLRLMLAGIFTYLFLRRIEVEPGGAVFSAIAFSFCGFVIVWLNHPPANAAVFLPALFYAAEGVHQRRSLGRCGLLAAFGATQLLTGHVETSLHIMTAAGTYFLVRTFTVGRPGWPRAILLFAVSWALAFLLAAPQLLPLGEYLLQSSTLLSRAAEEPYTFYWKIALGSVPALALPTLYGSPLAGQGYFGSMLGMPNFNELNGAYVGVLTLVLAVIGVIAWRRRSLVFFFLAWAIFSFGVVHELPGFYQLVYILPFFNVTANNRLTLLLAFSLSVLAGMGLHGMARRAAKESSQLCGWIAGIVALLAVLATILVLAVGEGFASAAARFATDIVRTPEVAGEVSAAQQEALQGRVRALALENLIRIAIFAGSAGLLLLFHVRRGLRSRQLVVLAITVLIVDLFHFGVDYNPAIEKAKVFPSTPSLEFLKEKTSGAEPWRVLPLGGALLPNTGTFYEIPDVRGYDAIEIEAYNQYLNLVTPLPPFTTFRSSGFSAYESPLIDLLGVKYIMSDEPLVGSALTPVFKKDVRIYENRRALPRAFTVQQVRACSSDEEVLRALKQPGFQPLQEAPLVSGGTLEVVSRTTADFGLPEFEEYLPNRVRIKLRPVGSGLDRGRSGVLVFTDPYYHGWKCYVNGEATEIHRANHIFRAVSLPTSVTEVDFVYEPCSFRVGCSLAMSALLLLPLLMTYGLMRRGAGGRRPD